MADRCNVAVTAANAADAIKKMRSLKIIMIIERSRPFWGGFLSCIKISSADILILNVVIESYGWGSDCKKTD